MLAEFVILSEALNWKSLDGTLSGPEGFAKDWNDTVKKGGTRHDVAARWGISPQVASNRALTVLPKLGFQMLDFGSQRGRGAKIATPTVGQAPRVGAINPLEVAGLMSKHKGDMTKAGAEMGLTYSQMYALVRKIRTERPDIEIMMKSRGRQKLENVPTDEEFREIWNSSENTNDMYARFKSVYPDLAPGFVKALAYKIMKRNEEGFLQKLPDLRSMRWKLTQGEELSGEPEFTDEENVDDIFTGESVPEPAEEPAPEVVPEEEPPADEPLEDIEEPEESGPTLDPDDQAFVDAWNSASTKEDAFKTLKRLGWSSSVIKEKRLELKALGVKLQKFNF